MKIGITGVKGMVGFHVRGVLRGQKDVEVSGADRATFASSAALDEFVSSVDVLVHLAGMNRGDDAEIEKTNIDLTSALIAACERSQCRPHIFFASSTHVMRDTAYARSKRECSRLLGEWAAKTGACFSNLILPHVFGEGGKPFYNSVVSTFCHQLASGTVPEIINDGDLELVHAQQVAETILNIVREPVTGDVRVAGVPMKVSELLMKLREFDKFYRGQIMPDVRETFDLYLFNTYRSYLFTSGFYPVNLQLHQDSRGGLFEAVKSLNGGQSFVSTTKPGISRGNHYHTKKIERFLVLNGKGLIQIRRLFSDEVIEFEVTGDCPQYVDMPTLHTHNITNVGESDMTTLFWSHEFFDPQCPDTFPEPVKSPS
ncbi:MAG: polysaccharide biosynthesis C-terminal domain-containing protein [Gammaproteobacteria bacterium]